MAICNVPEGMKLNKFRLVRCPKPSEIAQVHGYRVPNGNAYSGDENVCDDLRKTEQLARDMQAVRDAVDKMPKQTD